MRGNTGSYLRDGEGCSVASLLASDVRLMMMMMMMLMMLLLMEVSC